MARRKVAPIARSAGLDGDRPPLGRSRYVQRACHRVISAAMRDRVNLRCVDKACVKLVADKGIILPAIPQRVHDLRKFLGAVIARLVLKHAGQTEIATRSCIRRGNSVPARAAAAGVVERRKASGDVVGLVVGRRGGRDQPDIFRGSSDRRQRDRRFHRHEGAILDAIGDCRRIGEENRVELSALGNLRDTNIVPNIEARIRVAVWQPPGGSISAGVQEIDVEMKLTGHDGLGKIRL